MEVGDDADGWLAFLHVFLPRASQWATGRCTVVMHDPYAAAPTARDRHAHACAPPRSIAAAQFGDVATAAAAREPVFRELFAGIYHPPPLDRFVVVDPVGLTLRQKLPTPFFARPKIRPGDGGLLSKVAFMHVPDRTVAPEVRGDDARGMPRTGSPQQCELDAYYEQALASTAAAAATPAPAPAPAPAAAPCAPVTSTPRPPQERHVEQQWRQRELSVHSLEVALATPRRLISFGAGFRYRPRSARVARKGDAPTLPRTPRPPHPTTSTVPILRRPDPKMELIFPAPTTVQATDLMRCVLSARSHWTRQDQFDDVAAMTVAANVAVAFNHQCDLHRIARIGLPRFVGIVDFWRPGEHGGNAIITCRVDVPSPFDVEAFAEEARVSASPRLRLLRAAQHDAFLHFSWELSGHAYAIKVVKAIGHCVVEVVVCTNAAAESNVPPGFTSPPFGRRNEGIRGLQRWANEHRCGSVCKAMCLPPMVTF